MRHPAPAGPDPGPIATAGGGAIILCADDYAMTEGVSRGIEELAAVGRLSAASALVTLPAWAAHGPRLAALRPRIAIGLHVNLTLGTPLGPMPNLAPSDALPALKALLMRGLAGRLDAAEIAAEVSRQIARFEQGTGHSPDFIDGHEHVHVLPGVRDGFIRAIVARFAAERPLVRDPADRVLAILARGGPIWKALILCVLAAGFGARVRRAGFPTNQGFAGVSTFDRASPFARELERFFRHPGSRHLVMCHPGYRDAELERRDPVVERRRQELDALMSAPGLDQAIWHPLRTAEGPVPGWPRVVATA